MIQLPNGPTWLPHGPNNEHYRPDIDGLRGIAVLTVVGFHVGLPGFGGGFLGVDIFFVISGFLITTLLLHELSLRGSINFAAFLARRARRLLPAFLVVIITTLVLGSFFLGVIDQGQQRLAVSAKAAALYVSNLHFAWIGDDYFAPESALSPLLHTWSLGVEEQFYLIWPLILLGAAWVAYRSHVGFAWIIAGILAILVAASLGYNHWSKGSGPLAGRFAFFTLQARAWELGLGASLALVLRNLPRNRAWIGVWLTAAGLVAVAAGTMLAQHRVLAHMMAYLPPLGTAAAIAGVWLAPHAATAKLLAFRPLVIVGLLSYSWYLWHWPLLSIARASSPEMHDIGRDGAIAILALGLAYLTYTFVEQPFRTFKLGYGWSSTRVIAAAALTSLLVIGGSEAMLTRATHVAETEKHLARLKKAYEDRGWSRGRCRNDPDFNELVSWPECVGIANATQKVFAVWGDSHADHLVGAFENAVDGLDIVLLPRWMASCPPLLGAVSEKEGRPFDDCARFNAAVVSELSQLKREKRLAGLAIAARWSMYLGMPSLVRGDKASVLWRRGQRLEGEAAAAALSASLQATLRTLAGHDISVLVVAPVPMQIEDVPSCLAKQPPRRCSVSRLLAEEDRRLPLQAVERALEGTSKAFLWDPFTALCDKSRCLAEQDGVVMYADNDHLTYTGAARLAPDLQQSCAWRGALINP
jgi:peptidoglycan/LPS O-acetylase OafA/YrhL